MVLRRPEPQATARTWTPCWHIPDTSCGAARMQQNASTNGEARRSYAEDRSDTANRAYLNCGRR